MSVLRITAIALFAAASSPAVAGGFQGSGFGNAVIGFNVGTYSASGTYTGGTSCTAGKCTSTGGGYTAGGTGTGFGGVVGVAGQFSFGPKKTR